MTCNRITRKAQQVVVEPLHSTIDPAATKSPVESLQSIADSDATTNAPTDTTCS
jgi:hypothetical protein